jgi:phosphate transport system ATP-binding protein
MTPDHANPPSSTPAAAAHAPKIEVQNFSAFYDEQPVLRHLSLQAFPHEILSLIGPSGSGKSTLLRCLNRLNDLAHNFRFEGGILFEGRDLFDPHLDVAWLRRRMGMINPTPNPLPYSIYENIAFALRLEGMRDHDQVQQTLTRCLRRVDLWDQVKDRLDTPALRLTTVQQQLLCLARVLSLEPSVLLLDKPCVCLDAQAATRFEDVLQELKKNYCVIMATHDNRQAARASDRVVFLLKGTLVESGTAHEVYFNPKDPRTLAYVRERF